MIAFALTSESSSTDVNAAVPEMARQLALQQSRLASWWERSPSSVSYAAHAADVPKDPSICLVSFADQLDDPGALAYHTTDVHGRPCIFLSVSLIRAHVTGDWVHGPGGVLAAISHEMCEARINPYVNTWVDIDGLTEAPIEVCDWTQGDFYEEEAGSGWFVSNFVGPRFFSGSVGPYDVMGVCSPRTLRPGGYFTPRRVGTGQVAPVYGDRMPDWQRAAKERGGSRCARILGR